MWHTAEQVWDKKMNWGDDFAAQTLVLIPDWPLALDQEDVES